MPLESGSSREAFSHNVKAEIAADKINGRKDSSSVAALVEADADEPTLVRKARLEYHELLRLQAQAPETERWKFGKDLGYAKAKFYVEKEAAAVKGRGDADDFRAVRVPGGWSVHCPGGATINVPGRDVDATKAVLQAKRQCVAEKADALCGRMDSLVSRSPSDEYIRVENRLDKLRDALDRAKTVAEKEGLRDKIKDEEKTLSRLKRQREQEEKRASGTYGK